MVYSEFDDNQNILKTYFNSIVSKKEIVDYINSTRLNKHHPRKLKILTDSRKSKMVLEERDIREIVDANNKSLKEYDFIADAIVLENSQDVLHSLFYKKLSKADNYYFMLFANYDKALDWLLTFQPE